MRKQPNIVFILSDDQGAWALGCAGNREIRTPHLDCLAAQGMRFDRFFCVSPVCSPARASLLTGTIPSAHGVLDWLAGGNFDTEKFAEQAAENPYGHTRPGDVPIQYLAGQVTYPDILAQNGYNCALCGKWHLGDSVHPQHGFTRWFTLGAGGCCYYHPDIVENGTLSVRHGTYVTDAITDKALTYLDELSAQPQPFYLSIHYTAPHSPWGEQEHPAEFLALYSDCPFASTPDVPDHPCAVGEPVYGTEKRRENLRGYYAAVTAMDAGIGRILDRLTQKGLLENTLVVFTSDNGMNMGHHGIWGKGNGTFPLNLYDTSLLVPFLAVWPGHIPAGTVCHRMVSAYDWFPTLMELLALPFTADRPLPGHSFAAALLGNDAPAAAPLVVYDEYGPARMIRTDAYKYITRYPYGPDELYDLQKDPEEMHNLLGFAAGAEGSAQETAFSLRRQMERWFARYTDPARDGAKEGVTGRGQLCMAGRYAQRWARYAGTPPCQPTAWP